MLLYARGLFSSPSSLRLNPFTLSVLRVELALFAKLSTNEGNQPLRAIVHQVAAMPRLLPVYIHKPVSHEGSHVLLPTFFHPYPSASHRFQKFS